MVDGGSIKPVVYKERYDGLGDVARGLEDVGSRKVWGRAVVTISDGERTERGLKL